MATQQLSLLPHELAALLAAKANQIAVYIGNTGPAVNLDCDAIAGELQRMHELTLELREKVSGSRARAEAENQGEAAAQ